MSSNETPDDPAVHTAEKRSSRRTVVAATAAVITATLAGMGAIHSAAADTVPATPGPGASTLPDSIMQQQNRLSELNTWIISQPDVYANGYVASVNDAQAGSTILLWHGEANQTQKAIIQKATQLGITVTVQQRKHSMADILRGQKALEGHSGHGVFANFTINSTAGLTADFDGIIVYGEYISPPVQGRAEADAALAEAVSQEIGVTVSIEPGGVITPA
ncbi:hypothetical protein [Actinoplanes siamensis]|uniref:Uncharacterized protein n=1 Tax=Actinoplanes siamensis TaxID=1223317 RepID=A0A919ND15_9ACTN|nr:hypothetical protein [Actinoplanes siamensis]GIF08982.1 hypothetical protein Asi03nite_65200 [Actinoplanes siamensis]